MFNNISLTDNISYHENLDTTFVIDYLKSNPYTKDLISIRSNYLTNEYSIIELAEFVKEYISREFNINCFMTGIHDVMSIRPCDDADCFMVNISADWDFMEKLKYEVSLSIIGPKDMVLKMRSEFVSKFKKKHARISWWYHSKRGGVSHVSLEIPQPKPIYNEFYPWFNDYGGPVEYFKRYMESEANILLLSGDPGTGKTSFLRYMIWQTNVDAYVTYDDKVIEEDTMFIDFISGNSSEMLILEDAETTLLPRKANNNSMITRLLNVSEGLIKFPRKKMIFTTNDSNFSNVDQAIIRPGRCFGIEEFRALTYDEATKAAEVAGLPVPEKKQDYTLAQLFNQTTKRHKAMEFGFKS